MPDQNTEHQPAPAADQRSAGLQAPEFTMITHRCGHWDRHYAAIPDRTAYEAWLADHDCGLCALHDLAEGVVLDRPLPPLLDPDPARVLRADFFRRDALARVLNICTYDLRYQAAVFPKWDTAVRSILRRRSAGWWLDFSLWPGFSVQALVDQFAAGTPRSPHFVSAAARGKEVVPTIFRPYGAEDFLDAEDEPKFGFDPAHDDFLDRFGAVIKDVRETWELIQAGQGEQKLFAAGRLTYRERFDRQVRLLEQGFAQLEDLFPRANGTD